MSVRTTSVVLRVVGAAVAACVAVGCDAGPPPSSQPATEDVCGTYTEHRDGPPEDATSFADQLEAAGVPADLAKPARAGFATYLVYLRNEGDGRDEDSYEDQYAAVLDRPARSDLLAFLDAVDRRCGIARSDAAPTDATDRDYCTAFETAFGRERSDLLARTGTPADLGIDPGADHDLSAESRRGFRAIAYAVAHLTDDQAEALDEGPDDAMRQVVGVTDAFFADTWFLESYERCVGED